ncbi:MAG: thermonuclease family protein [Deltaproteobacteria bacterium]|nr:thermonuclease family protein [Deltaproteobacteria bacterium]
MKTKDGKQLFNALFEELAALYEPVARMSDEARNRLKVKVFWQMGHRMSELMQDEQGDRSARYGDNVVGQLSQAFKARFGKGFGRSLLFCMRQFAEEIPKENISPTLAFSHYRLLLGVGDIALREKLALSAAEAQLSVEALRVLINQSATPEAEIRHGKEFLLSPRLGRTGLVKVEKDPLGAQVWLVNLGFNIRRSGLLKRTDALSDGDIVELGRVGKLKKLNCKKTERYTYDARVLKVVDGDTLALRISLADSTLVDERIRLRGVDAKERLSKAGEAATAFVRRRLPTGTTVRLHTFTDDRYGRYVGDIFYGERDVWLNRELVESGLAKFLDMKV